MVDAADLKSVDRISREGSSPSAPIHKFPLCFALCLNTFPTQAGLASALIGVVREGGELIVFLSLTLLTTSQVPVAIVLLAMRVLSTGLLREYWG